MKIVVLSSQQLLSTVTEALNEPENTTTVAISLEQAKNDIINQIAIHSPDVIVIDNKSSQCSVFELIDSIKRVFFSIAVVVLGSSPQNKNNEIFESVKCGAAAYVHGEYYSNGVLLDTVRKVCEGKSPISRTIVNSPEIASRILRQFQDLSLLLKSGQNVLIPLTTEEENVLKLIASGHSGKKAAWIAGLTLEIIENRVSNIAQKLAANVRAYRLSSKVRNDMLSVRIARYGNLLLFSNNKPRPCTYNGYIVNGRAQ